MNVLRLISQLIGIETLRLTVLIKAVVQAIPTYTMNYFKLPKKLCIELECMVHKFWWGYKGDSQKIHWVK